MEEKTKTVEELQQEIEKLKNEVKSQKILVDAYHDEAEKYKGWWLQLDSKVKGMKDDVEDAQKLIKKLVERW